MNSKQHETSTSGSGAVGEDLNIILGRFQSWVSGRVRPSPGGLDEKPAAKETVSRKCAILPSDAREISYDQALRASRYRRQENVISFDPVPDAALHVGDDRPLADPPKDVSSPRRRCSADEDLEMNSDLNRWPAVSFTNLGAPVGDLLATAHQASIVPDALVADPPAERPAQMPVFVLESADPAAAERVVVSEDASSGGPIIDDDCYSPTTLDFEFAPLAVTSSSNGNSSENAFSEVLTRTMANTRSASRSICLTLQAADREQARLQESAARANLSAAVYVRQCAVVMDDLRAQMEMALSHARWGQQRKCRTGPGIIPFGLRQFGARCLRRLRQSNDKSVGLSIR